jgi:O-antigen ligase
MKNSRPFRARVSDLGVVGGLAVALVIALVLFGGASRSDALSQLFVRLACLTVLAALLWQPFARPFRYRAICVLLGLWALWMLAQLIPLPPSVWSVLPGRELFAEVAVMSGTDRIWRPLTLTPDLTWNSVFALLPCAAVLLLFVQSEGKYARLLVSCFLLAMAASAILGFAQVAAGPSSPLRFYGVTNADSAVGFFANRNHNAVFIAAGIPLLAGWLPTLRRSEDLAWKFTLALLAVPAAIVSSASTGSRVGLAVAAIGTLLSLPLWIGLGREALAGRTLTVPGVRKRIPTGRVVVLGSLVSLAAAAAIVASSTSVQRLFDRDITDELRVRVTPTLVEMTREFLPVGSGFGSFDPAYRAFEPFEALSLRYLNEAHNEVLQVLIEGGAIAGIIVLLFLCWFVWQSLLAWRSGTILSRAASIVILQLLLASLTDYPLRTPLLAALFTACCCLLADARSKGSIRGPSPRKDDAVFTMGRSGSRGLHGTQPS